ncbi:DNA cytosine methyltransferase [Amycolatopsis sp. A1MSW2902]|uniref:DNA cytosine methyltransferase n=1 Tax=Amycolatopsis sp. A1MSW2902 TaxID=687413 RepID=UPI00307DBC01
MKAGSLFTGTGALDMAAAEVFDAEPVWFADIDPAASALLAHRYPGVPNLRDITAVDWDLVALLAPIELLFAGWPCQPFSLAGKRKGAEDERALWPEVDRCIRALRPRYVLLENVPAVVGAELGRVADTLAACGYRFAWVCLPASAVGAPHKRERFFLLAVAEDADAQLAVNGGSQHPDKRKAGGHGPTLADEVEHLLPTPLANMNGPSQRELDAGNPKNRLETALHLLPTPNTGLSPNGHGRRGGKPGNGHQSGADLDVVVKMLPTPTVGDATGGHTTTGHGTPLLNGLARQLSTGLATPRNPPMGSHPRTASTRTYRSRITRRTCPESRVARVDDGASRRLDHRCSRVVPRAAAQACR